MVPNGVAHRGAWRERVTALSVACDAAQAIGRLCAANPADELMQDAHRRAVAEWYAAEDEYLALVNLVGIPTGVQVGA